MSVTARRLTMKYWIKYSNGDLKEFDAFNDLEAEWYAHTEGDHVLEWGCVTCTDKTLDLTIRDEVAMCIAEIHDCKRGLTTATPRQYSRWWRVVRALVSALEEKEMREGSPTQNNGRT